MLIQLTMRRGLYLALAASSLAMGLCISWPASAQTQEDAQRAERRQRLQLQRAQAELEEVGAQRDALQAAKSAADGKAKQLQAAQDMQLRSLAAARAEITRLRQANANLEEQLKRQVTEGDCMRTAHAQREGELSQALVAARRESADRLGTVQSMTRLLERSTSTNQAMQARNDALLQEALAAIEQYRQAAGTAEISIKDPLGWRAVRHENTVDAMRSRLDKLVTEPAASEPAR